MSTVNTAMPAPQSVLVMLEPSDRPTLDVERTELLAIAQLPADIVSPREYEELSKNLDQVEAWVKAKRPSFDTVCDQAHKAWQSALSLRRDYFSRFEGFCTDARKLLGRYKARQDEIRRAEQRRLEEEERQRQLARQREEAALLKKQGQPELAAAVMNTPVAAQPVTLPDAVPHLPKQSFRDEWKWRPVGGDSPEARAAAEKLVPREYLQLNDVKLNGIARSMKGTLKIPGIEFYAEKVLVRR
jgi:hypothetical protein